MKSIRTCISTKVKMHPDNLVKFKYYKAEDKIGIITVDKGRGAYLIPDINAFNEAILRKRIERALKMKRNLNSEEIDKLRNEFLIKIKSTIN